MKTRRVLSFLLLFFCSLLLIVSCTQTSEQSSSSDPEIPVISSRPIVIGYSNWVGWWPWAIAELEGMFEANGANVELRWFDSYPESMQAFAEGKIDGNCQTLNDTISFIDSAVNGEVTVLVNDNSAGNDKIIVAEEIKNFQDLKGKKVAVEAGLVDDFLLTLALEENGMSREDVEILSLEANFATSAFTTGKADAVGVYPPFWLRALTRKGSKELISSKAFPGAIPDLLVVSQKLVDQQPDQVQALVKTWFDIREFMEQNPEQADEIMATRAEINIEELEQFKAGTKFFSVQDNLEAFREGDSMKYMPFAARRMADFMVEVGFIEKAPDLSQLFDDRFIKAYAES